MWCPRTFLHRFRIELPGEDGRSTLERLQVAGRFVVFIFRSSSDESAFMSVSSAFVWWFSRYSVIHQEKSRGPVWSSVFFGVLEKHHDSRFGAWYPLENYNISFCRLALFSRWCSELPVWRDMLLARVDRFIKGFLKEELNAEVRLAEGFPNWPPINDPIKQTPKPKGWLWTCWKIDICLYNIYLYGLRSMYSILFWNYILWILFIILEGCLCTLMWTMRT